MKHTDDLFSRYFRDQQGYSTNLLKQHGKHFQRRMMFHRRRMQGG